MERYHQLLRNVSWFRESRISCAQPHRLFRKTGDLIINPFIIHVHRLRIVVESLAICVQHTCFLHRDALTSIVIIFNPRYWPRIADSYLGDFRIIIITHSSNEDCSYVIHILIDARTVSIRH